MKKAIALTLACVMLITSSPAVAADNASAKPTVEEILDSYHERAIAAQSQPDAAASTYSLRSTGKTLEQETVDELNAAGYEAYNVTGDNYENMQDVLNTDLASLGIPADGSYVVVISGEDEETGNGASTRAFDPPHIGGEEPGLGTGFTYTQDGTTYNMRYVIVTADENSALGVTDDVDLLDKMNIDTLMGVAEILITVYSLAGDYLGVGTVTGLLAGFVFDGAHAENEKLEFWGGAAWTITYLQIYDATDQVWHTRASYEYVTPSYTVIHMYFNTQLKKYETYTESDDLELFYSEHYSDTTWLKQRAVLANTYGTFYNDAVDSIIYKYKGEQILKIDRWMEYVGYNPS